MRFSDGVDLGPKMGVWYVTSEQDPRWNKTGHACGLICTGGPQEMWDWIKECKSKYGSTPDDCVYGFHKY